MWKYTGREFANVLDDIDWIGVLNEEANMADCRSKMCQEMGESLLRAETKLISDNPIPKSFDIPNHTDSLRHFDTSS